MSAVASMVCVHCSRLQGREHVEGCPHVVDCDELEAVRGYFAYERGWEAARAVTVEALAAQRAELAHVFEIADELNAAARGGLMLDAVRALCESKGLLP